MTLEEFVAQAGPVPFLDKGRSYLGWDCWGLVYCAFRDVLGVRLPAYAKAYASAQDVRSVARAIDDGKAGAWRKVETAQAMDGVLMNYDGHPVHIGLALDKRWMLHAFEKGGTVRERIIHAMAPNRVEGIYRYAP